MVVRDIERKGDFARANKNSISANVINFRFLWIANALNLAELAKILDPWASATRIYILRRSPENEKPKRATPLHCRFVPTQYIFIMPSLITRKRLKLLLAASIFQLPRRSKRRECEKYRPPSRFSLSSFLPRISRHRLKI